MFGKNTASFALIVLLLPAFGHAQSDSGQSTLRQEQPPVPVEEIIQKFAAREREFRNARANYTYRQDVRVQELNANDKVLGEYHLISDIVFDPTGKRTERIVFAPANT